MPVFFFQNKQAVFLVEADRDPPPRSVDILSWLLNAKHLKADEVKGRFTGPRKEMVTPWSTNAVEIAANTGVKGVHRIECFTRENGSSGFDPMLQQFNERNEDHDPGRETQCKSHKFFTGVSDRQTE